MVWRASLARTYLNKLIQYKKNRLPAMPQELARRTRRRVFTEWANAMLVAGGDKARFDDILSNLITGVDLCLLVSVLSGEEVKPRYSREKVSKSLHVELEFITLSTFLPLHLNMQFHGFRLNRDYCRKNIRKAIKKAGIENIAENRVMDGDPETILRLLWRLIKKFRVETCVKYSRHRMTAEKALLEWCQLKTRNSPSCGTHILDFDQSWMSGLPFVGLLHWRDPEKVPFDPDQAPAEACEFALTTGKKMGVPKLLKVSDVCNRKTRPDKRVILTYVAETYHVLNKREQCSIPP